MQARMIVFCLYHYKLMGILNTTIVCIMLLPIQQKDSLYLKMRTSRFGNFHILTRVTPLTELTFHCLIQDE